MADVAVQGKVLGPSGGSAGPGVIRLALNKAGTVGGSPVESRDEAIAIDGSVSFTITPNTDITPSGTLWVALFFPSSPDSRGWTEAWDLDATTPIDIGAITRV